MPRQIHEFRTASKESYQNFCKENPEIKITFKQFVDILYTYNDFLMMYLLDSGEIIKLPYGLGNIVINKYKPIKYKKLLNGETKLNLSVDWKETKKQGKKIYLMNYHTKGYKCYWMWSHRNARFKFPFMWKFEVNRKYSRLLNTYLTKKEIEYINIYKEYPRAK